MLHHDSLTPHLTLCNVSMGFQVNFIASWVVKLSLAMGASFLEVFFLYMVSHKLFSFELFVTTLTINRRRVSSSFVESHFVSCQKSLVTVRFFAKEFSLMRCQMITEFFSTVEICQSTKFARYCQIHLELSTYNLIFLTK